MLDINHLTPGIFTKNGKAYSLMTLMSTIYDLDGNTLESILHNMQPKMFSQMSVLDANTNTRRDGLGGCGTESAALAFGGIYNGTALNTTEIFNGTTWSVIQGGNLVNERANLAGCGTTSAALATGGEHLSMVQTAEIFDGSVWRLTSNPSYKRSQPVCVGNTTTALVFGGLNHEGENLDYILESESFNGSTWQIQQAIPGGKAGHGGCGSLYSALMFGGFTPTNNFDASGTTEEYNGLSWYEKSAVMNTPRTAMGYSGDYDNAVVLGGNRGEAGHTVSVERMFFDHWMVEDVELNQNRIGMGSAGSNNVIFSSAIIFNGWSRSGYVNTTEKYSAHIMSNGIVFTEDATVDLPNAVLTAEGSRKLVDSIPKITANLSYDISAGGNLLNARELLSGCGKSNAALATGGRNSAGAPMLTTEKFNGNSWSTAGNMPTARHSHGVAGKLNSATLFAGENNNGQYVIATETYDGTTWSTTDDELLNTRSMIGSNGTSTNAVASGGYFADFPQDYNRIVDVYNGFSWHILDNLVFGVYNHAACGSPINILASGGYNGSNAIEQNTQKYNGRSWFTTPAMSTGKVGHGAVGGGSTAVVFGGLTSPNTVSNAIEKFNGETWSTLSYSLDYNMYRGDACGDTTNGLCFGGLRTVNGIPITSTTLFTETSTFGPLDISDNFTSSDNLDILSANKGRELKEEIDNISDMIKDVVDVTPMFINQSIEDAVNELNVEDTAESGKYVSSVSESCGKINVTHESLVDNIPEATTSKKGLISSTDKSKLNNLQTNLDKKLDVAGGKITGDLIVNGFLENGAIVNNVLTFKGPMESDCNEIVIKTKIPAGLQQPICLCLTGYSYSLDIGLIKIAVYFTPVNSSGTDNFYFYNKGAVSDCRWKPDIYLSTYTAEDSNKYVALSLSGINEYSIFNIDMISHNTEYYISDNPKYISKGWTSEYRKTDDTASTTIIPPDNKTAVPYIATDIITYGTTDLEDGVSSLKTGTLYIVY